MSHVPIAVAVVSWNSAEYLRRCLSALHPEVQRGVAEVWVVDNASEDGSPEMVRDEFGWVKLIASEENLGYGTAVNMVAERTSSDWIVSSNEDIAVRPGALDAMLEAGARDPRAGAIAPRLVLPDGSTQHSAFAFPTLPYTFLINTTAYRLWPAIGDRYAIPAMWNTERARRIPWAIAAFLMFRRTAWDEIGGFDERQWMSAEDLDIGWRLREHGWVTRFEPRACVDHEGSVATSKLYGSENLMPHWQRATYGCIARRRGIAHAYAVAMLNVTGTLARAAVAAARGDRERARGLLDWAKVHVEALSGSATLEQFG